MVEAKAVESVPVETREPIAVPMELLDPQSQAALQGWCMGKELQGQYTLMLVPVGTD